MKKYIVIGNPIEHSLSPKLHNFWFKRNNIDAIYEKKKVEINEIKDLILDLKKKKINGINVTVPFKKDVINFLDQLSLESKETQSVNTIFLKNDKVIGHNTDIDGFQIAIENLTTDLKIKSALILGAGGVVSSIIFALNKMKIPKIILSNRTKKKAEDMKNLFNNINIVEWGNIPDADMIINATSVGLKKKDELNLDFSKFKKKFFYDVIYNPKITNFLELGKELGNKIENGEMMFIFQAQEAFKIWHGIKPQVTNELINFLRQ